MRASRITLILLLCPVLLLSVQPGFAQLFGPRSGSEIGIGKARILTDNDAAFEAKLDLVRNARRSLDLMYYIYSDDHSSSVFTQALLDAARRGVKVRLLVDYPTNYKHLDLFSLMEARGHGNLQVRLYNRPTRNVIKDAAFMTLGCGKENPSADPTRCSKEKLAAIDKLFAEETIGGKPVGTRNISNLNVAGSGLFLSGLYGKQFDVMALAVREGQDVELSQGVGDVSADQKEGLKRLGRTYWRAKTGNAFQRTRANLQLFYAFSVYGDQLNPVRESLTSFLPVEKDFSGEGSQDWDHITDYLHHKFLLADGSRLQMGGRNIEDSYHMQPNELTEKYVFLDTDLSAEILRGGDRLSRAFEDLWSFEAMVATIADVRQHAPNDFVANLEAYEAAEEGCKTRTDTAERERCTAERLAGTVKSLPERMADREREMQERAGIYGSRYVAKPATGAAAGFEVDRTAAVTYLENLPFDRKLAPQKRHRLYGAVNGREGRSGKAIHEAWVRDLPNVCRAASARNPKTVVLHNAYFFPSSNLTYALSRMVNGDYDCRHVTVRVLTNSIQTTDLNIVNLMARHWLKAFIEFHDQKGHPARKARFEYYEYQPRSGEGNRSLHSKVSLLGDELLVGSANADVRSYMMDTNNVLLLRKAPALVRSYNDFLNRLMADPTRVKQATQYFRTTPREQMIAEDRAVLKLLLAKYGAGGRMDPGQAALLEARFVQALNDAYTLTKGSIEQDKRNPRGAAARRLDSQRRFNEKFKAI